MNVFLVEDSEMILAHLRRIVSEVPGTIVLGEARSQDDAVTGIAATDPDVVILDLTLAEGNGIEVLRRIRPLRPDATIIILTIKSAQQYRSRCLALGADYFLDKAHDMEALPRHLAALRARPQDAGKTQP